MDRYVARCARWEWHDKARIDVLDGAGNVQTTLDRLQTWIFYEADGGRTVRKLLAWMAFHYQEGNEPPPNLDATHLQALKTLVEDLGVIELCEEPPVLDDEFLIPWSEVEQGGASSEGTNTP